MAGSAGLPAAPDPGPIRVTGSGEMINRLEAHGSYEDTLIIVVADHGVSVRPEQHPRRITPETVGDIAPYRSSSSAPRQTDGGIDDYRAESVDVVRTIADVLGIDVLWTMEGTSSSPPAGHGGS